MDVRQDSYYFHSRTGTDNTCPKFEELEKDAVGDLSPSKERNHWKNMLMPSKMIPMEA